MRAGIFVGGKSSRMGGKPKGLLHAPGTKTPLVVRLASIARSVGLEPVFVGKTDDAYRSLLPDLRIIDDAPGVEGPLAGLAALLDDAGDSSVIALACDLPFVETNLLMRLASEHRDALILSPRASPNAPWEPLLARYDAPRVRPVLQQALADGVRSFQKLFARLEVSELVLSESERLQLRDWDETGDVA